MALGAMGWGSISSRLQTGLLNSAEERQTQIIQQFQISAKLRVIIAMSKIPIRDRAIGKGIALLEIGDRGRIQSIVGELPRIALEITGQDFQFAEDTEGAVVFPVGEFDPIGAGALVEWVDLLGEMLNVGLGLGQLNIHLCNFFAGKILLSSRSVSLSASWIRSLHLCPRLIFHR
jgi:hypothetical protein